MNSPTDLDETQRLLGHSQAALADALVNAKRAEEVRRLLLHSAEESLRNARQALSDLGGIPEGPEALSGAISSLADSLESLLSAMRAI